MKKILGLLIAIVSITALTGCGGDEVQVVLVSKLVGPEKRSALIKNSSRLCTKLNSEDISCQLKLNGQGRQPLVIKMFKGGVKKEIVSFESEDQLIEDIRTYMR